jgi:hypothetical protein
VKETKEARRLKKLHRVQLVELEKTTVLFRNDNVVSFHVASGHHYPEARVSSLLSRISQSGSSHSYVIRKPVGKFCILPLSLLGNVKNS